MSLRTGRHFTYLSFNQDAGCFVMSNRKGISVFNADPFSLALSRDFPSGTIGIVEMLYRTNIFAICGGGPAPAFPSNELVFWDDHKSEVVGQLSCPDIITGVRLRRDKVFVALERTLYVYDFDTLEEVANYSTEENALGIIAISSSPHACVMACPARQPGFVRVENFSEKQSVVFRAHDSGIRMLTLSVDGRYLATTSIKGTIIRVYDTTSDCTKPMKELRRGRNTAELFSLSFSRDASLLCACSDKGTLHIFSLSGLEVRDESVVASESSSKQSETPTLQPENRKSKLAFAGNFLPKYFKSEWSFAKFKAPEVAALCTFGNKSNNVILVTQDGQYFELFFDSADGGDCERGSYFKFGDEL